MLRHALEIADIFRAHGMAWRQAEAGHLSLGQFKVMAAIERCRTAALGGHVAACEARTPEHIAHNSCRNRPPTTIMAPNARGRPPGSGWPHARPSGCRRPTSTSCSPYRHRSPASPMTRNRQPSPNPARAAHDHRRDLRARRRTSQHAADRSAPWGGADMIR